MSPLSFANLCLAERASMLHDNNVGQDCKYIWVDPEVSLGNSGDGHSGREICADLLCNDGLSVGVIMSSELACMSGTSQSQLNFADSRYDLPAPATTSNTRPVVAVVVDVRPAIHYMIGHLTGTENWPIDVLLRDVLKLQHMLARLHCVKSTKSLSEPLQFSDTQTIKVC
eukprot:GHVS01013760.1.p1 GENE.GHVS01013760.1~~GHVS01013760.1.p1  ORF type:complete len:170 (-),score=8.56 GHVS01013760.1:44-553(-)